MAILDDLLNKLKRNTLDKTNIDERIVNAVRPLRQLPRQAVNQFNPEINNTLASRVARSSAYDNLLVKPQQAIQSGDIFNRFKQPEEAVKRNPWLAFTNASLGLGNTLLKVPTQVGYDIANKRMWQGKEAPISAPVNLGKLLPEARNLKTMTPGQRKMYLSEVGKRAVESVKPIALASGLNAPKIVGTMTALGGGLGYGGARLQGQEGKEAVNTAIQSAGEQFGRAVTMAGLMRFTNPVGDKLGQMTVDKLAKMGAPKFAQFLGKYTAQGGLNTAEGIALNPLIDRPMFEDVLVDFLMPGTLAITGKSLKGVTSGGFKLLKDSLRRMDPEGFDGAVRVLKEQGVKLSDTAVNEVRTVMNGARIAVSPDVQLVGGTRVSAGSLGLDQPMMSKGVDVNSRYIKGANGKFVGSRAGEPKVLDPKQESKTPEQPKDLVALHNVDADRLPYVTKMGGIPAPSFAVTKKNLPFESFGDSTIVASKESVDPQASSLNKIFDADAYSPRTPSPSYEINRPEANKVFSYLKPYFDRVDDSPYLIEDDVFKSDYSVDDIVNNIKRRNGVKLAFIEEATGQKVNIPEYDIAKNMNPLLSTPVMQDLMKGGIVPNANTDAFKDKNGWGYALINKAIREYIDSLPTELRGVMEESMKERFFDKQTGELFFGTFDRLMNDAQRLLKRPKGVEKSVLTTMLDSGIKNIGENKFQEWLKQLAVNTRGAEYLDKSGRKLPYNLDTVSQMMTGKGIRGQESGFGMFSPVNRLKSLMSKSFKSIDAVKKDADRIIEVPKSEEIDAELNRRFTDIADRILAGTGEDYGFRGYDTITGLLSDFVKRGAKTESRLRGIVESYGIKNVKDTDIADLFSFVQDLKNAPNTYFEAKLARPYKLSEAKGIIVPKGNGEQVRAQLRERGLDVRVEEYDPDVPNDRNTVLNTKFPDATFGIVPIMEPEYDENGNITGYKFSVEKTAMASLALGGLREIKKGDLDSAMKSLNRLPSFKGYGENAKDLIVQEAKRLADSIEGVEIIQNGIDSGRGIRVSRNPEWYRSFYSNNGRPPTNQELFELAEDNLRTNRLTGDVNDPNELKAVNEFLDAEIKGTEQPISDIMPKGDTLALPARQNVPLLQSPQEVINSKKKLIDIFKKTGEVKPYLNQLRPKTKAIPMGAQVIPGAKSGDEARAIKEQYGKMPEIQQQNVPGTNKVYEQPGLTIDDRGKRIEEVLYGSATPERQDLGGKKEGAGLFSNLMRKGQGMVSDRVGEALSSPNSIVRNTASILQDLAGNLGKSGEQVTKRSQFAGGIDYATKMGNDTQRYVTDLLGKDLGSLERVHSVLDPELATTKVDYENLSPKEKEATDFLRYVSDFINETNYKNGFITEEKYRSNTGGKYIARAYEPYDFPPEFADFMEQRNQKLDLNPFKERGDVTDWKQENAVKDPAYLVAKRLQQTMFNDNFRNMANWLKSTELVSESPKPGYVQVSDHKAYGDMAGQYVRKDALEDIKGFFFANQTAQKAYDMLNAWDKLAPRRFRKKMLTVFNPATRLGNQVGNYVFAWFNGINPVTFGSNKGWAKNAIKSNDPLYRRAIQDGLLGTDLTRGDIQRFASELKTGTKDPGILQKINQVLSDSYGRVDDLAKLSALKTHLDRGYSYEEAYKRVYNGFQNYNAVGFLYDVGAKIPLLGNPFVRFKADILRMMKNAVMDHPIRAVGTVLAWKLFTDLTSMASNETEEDKAVREDRLGAPRIPFTDVSLAVQTPWGELNASRLIGLYSLNQLNESSNTGDVFDYLPFEKPAIKNLGSDPLIGGLVSLATDTDFRGKKISDPDYNKYTGSTLTSEEKNANRLKYLARAYNLPSVNDLSDVNKAFKGEENFYGQKRTPLQAILRTAGLKVEQYGADEAQLARDKDAMYSANAIDAERSRISQIKNQLGRGEISETQANSRIEAIEKNITKLEAKMGGSGDKNVAGATAGSLPETRVKSLNTIFNVGSINNMPEGSNYEKAQKEAKQFEVINKVLGSDFLTPEEQEQYLSQTTKYKKEEIGYYRVAKGGVDERYGFVLDKIEAQPKDLMQTLATMRYEIDEKKILTNNLIDRLEDEGYLSDAQAKLLKKLEYNQATGKIGKTASGSGGSSNKVAKAIAKLNSENGEDLKALFDSFAGANAKRKSSTTLPLLQATQRLNAINKPRGKSISDVLSSKRVIKPIAKIG